jgi:hypothetical protein
LLELDKHKKIPGRIGVRDLHSTGACIKEILGEIGIKVALRDWSQGCSNCIRA